MNAEDVVGPLRTALQGLLSHAPLTDADRAALTELDTRAARLGTGYGRITGPETTMALSRDMSELHDKAAPIAARYVRS